MFSLAKNLILQSLGRPTREAQWNFHGDTISSQRNGFPVLLEYYITNHHRYEVVKYNSEFVSHESQRGIILPLGKNLSTDEGNISDKVIA